MTEDERAAREWLNKNAVDYDVEGHGPNDTDIAEQAWLAGLAAGRAEGSPGALSYPLPEGCVWRGNDEQGWCLWMHIEGEGEARLFVVNGELRSPDIEDWPVACTLAVLHRAGLLGDAGGTT